MLLVHTWEVHFHSSKEWDRRGYEEAVAATDEYLGTLFAALGQDTVVVVTGDHGENFAESALGERLRKGAKKIRRRGVGEWWPALDDRLSRTMGHGYGLDEQLIRVPLLLWGPNIGPRQIDQQVRHVDLLPTLADLCGVDVGTSKFDGRALTPLMQGHSLAEEPAYMETSGVPVTIGLKAADEAKLELRRVIGVRDERWKYLRKGTGKRLLYRTEGLYRWDGGGRNDRVRNVLDDNEDVVRRFESYVDDVAATSVVSDSGMTESEEAVVEERLRDLGYL